jgi:hypothetical protein
VIKVEETNIKELIALLELCNTDELLVVQDLIRVMIEKRAQFEGERFTKIINKVE